MLPHDCLVSWRSVTNCLVSKMCPARLCPWINSTTSSEKDLWFISGFCRGRDDDTHINISELFLKTMKKALKLWSFSKSIVQCDHWKEVYTNKLNHLTIDKYTTAHRAQIQTHKYNVQITWDIMITLACLSIRFEVSKRAFLLAVSVTIPFCSVNCLQKCYFERRSAVYNSFEAFLNFACCKFSIPYLYLGPVHTSFGSKALRSMILEKIFYLICQIKVVFVGELCLFLKRNSENIRQWKKQIGIITYKYSKTSI